ncbi:hypothetical protein, partial [Shigella sonnei]|uniref:hypothetical protein n=1 Tax=Shigella sonnei TaxID=624 RepID=UPI001C0A7798
PFPGGKHGLAKDFLTGCVRTSVKIPPKPGGGEIKPGTTRRRISGIHKESVLSVKFKWWECASGCK